MSEDFLLLSLLAGEHNIPAIQEGLQSGRFEYFQVVVCYAEKKTRSP